MKVFAGAFNQEKALVGAFSVIVQHLQHYSTPRTFSKPRVNSFLLPAAHLLVPRPVSSVDQVAYSRSP